MALFKRITAPAVTPVSLDEVKRNLDVSYDDKDDLITGLIAAATEYLDGRGGALGCAMVTQTWEMSLDCFPIREIEIPFGPIQSVTSIKYDDADGNEQTVDSSDYQTDLISDPAWIIPNSGVSWPSSVLNAANAVRVEFIAGYGGANEVPAPLRQAIHLLVRHWFDNPSAVFVGQAQVQTVPFAVDALITNYRRFYS